MKRHLKKLKSQKDIKYIKSEQNKLQNLIIPCMHNFNFKYADFMSRIVKDCFEPKANKQKPNN